MNTHLSFACDYMEGTHPAILQKLVETNLEKTGGYGLDPYCDAAKEKIKAACGCPEGEVFFLVGGTQTNATVIDALLKSYQGVIAAEIGHVSVHEAGANEADGHKVLTLPHDNGKISADQVRGLLDGFYNTPAWQALTRELILNDKTFLHKFLEYLIRINLIDQPMSLEKRGLILYEYCKQNCPEYQTQASIAWIEAGMSLKKAPAEKAKTKHQISPEKWEVIYGHYKDSLRLCFLPTDDSSQSGYWFGFESEIQRTTPVFKAKTISQQSHQATHE